MTDRYAKSDAMLARALRTIPLGSQTFSKSITQYPRGVSPLFLTKGRGSRVWDVDGNEYIDLVNGLAAITLGYCDPDVTAAVKEQIDSGVVFSLPHPIEAAVAEKIVEMVPCAEMVRFGKNGSDATAAAIRLARAHTGRSHVLACGYHGWQDWYIGSTTRNLGVPPAVRRLTHTFPFNDIDALDALFREHQDKVAAVILEPMNVADPREKYLHEVKALTHRNGALLVFDETITGFRLAPGGAQEYFGVVPDLAALGKGIANGYPLSAIAGRADVMRMMEEIFFSTTFGGEAVSLAASLATLHKLQREPVIPTLHARGRMLASGLEQIIAGYGLDDVLQVAGHPSWSFLLIKDAPDCSQWEIRTLILQEMFARGILFIGSHNMSYSHSEADVALVLKAYDEVLALVKAALPKGQMKRHLRCEPLKPLFRIR